MSVCVCVCICVCVHLRVLVCALGRVRACCSVVHACVCILCVRMCVCVCVCVCVSTASSSANFILSWGPVSYDAINCHSFSPDYLRDQDLSAGWLIPWLGPVGLVPLVATLGLLVRRHFVPGAYKTPLPHSTRPLVAFMRVPPCFCEEMPQPIQASSCLGSWLAAVACAATLCAGCPQARAA